IGPAASADANGLVTGAATGSSTITVTDLESGKSASTTVTVSEQTYLINGQPYVPANPRETMTAVFAQPDGGISTNSYQGFILVNASGTGQSYSTAYNDAFYLFTASFTSPQNVHDGGFYQLAFATR